ncbi:unnamed protein product [Clavelina lepadiformis]
MFVFLYMTFAFSVCLLECVRKKPSLTKGVVVIEMAEKQQNDERNFDKFLHRTKAMSGEKMRWYHITTGLMFVVAMDTAVIVSCLYPIVQDSTYHGFSYFSINIHLINLVLLLVDLILNAIPLYMIQFVIITAISALYGIILLLLHVTHIKSAVYDSIDWGEAPLQALLVTLAMIIIAPVVVHAFVFGLYSFKRFLVNCFCKK